ncbi:MAG: hypothetical protein LBH90_03140, partial [Tannerella sp.]|nr:hypothetical protein [Tannerella sp.]
SFNQVCRVLSDYPLVVIKPVSADLPPVVKQYPSLTVKSFDDCYFRDRNGYNKLMLSGLFYADFLHTKYILIYQLDAYVFRNELSYWCEKDYDYTGAPWLKKPVYNLPVISGMMKFSSRYRHRKGLKSKQDLYNKVGNGGFSLRKVESFYHAITEHEDLIRPYLEQRGGDHLYNEDVFWASIPNFKYPDVEEALAFAFDKYPALCYQLNRGRLPFGCHGWYKRKMKSFWKPVIGFR